MDKQLNYAYVRLATLCFVLAFFFWRIVRSTMSFQEQDDDSEDEVGEADSISSGIIRRRSARLLAKSKLG